MAIRLCFTVPDDHAPALRKMMCRAIYELDADDRKMVEMLENNPDFTLGKIRYDLEKIGIRRNISTLRIACEKLGLERND